MAIRIGTDRLRSVARVIRDSPFRGPRAFRGTALAFNPFAASVPEFTACLERSRVFPWSRIVRDLEPENYGVTNETRAAGHP